MSSIQKTALIFFTLLFIIFLSREHFRDSGRVTQKNYHTIVAFGDSLTFGYGANREQSYPAHLQRLLGVRVINEGISGEVSSQGLRRIQSVLQRHHPDLIIICHGGNDILRHKSKIELTQNLESMIALSQKSGADVLLVAVPNLSLFGLGALELYEETAEKYHTLFEEKILSTVLSDANLKSDQIHPNAQGYEEMAKAFAVLIKK